MYAKVMLVSRWYLYFYRHFLFTRNTNIMYINNNLELKHLEANVGKCLTLVHKTENQPRGKNASCKQYVIKNQFNLIVYVN